MNLRRLKTTIIQCLKSKITSIFCNKKTVFLRGKLDKPLPSLPSSLVLPISPFTSPNQIKGGGYYYNCRSENNAFQFCCCNHSLKHLLIEKAP